jgi:hypothetical protein
MADKIDELRARYDVMKDTFDNYWRPDMVALSRSFFARKLRSLEDVDKKEGSLRMDILDGVGIRSRRILSSGMHAGMTSPVRPWFRLTLADTDLATFPSVKEWLDDSAKRMLGLLGRSNFYDAMLRVYDQIGVFGTAFMFEHPDAIMGLRFNTLSCGQYTLDINEFERVDTVARLIQMSAKNIVSMFGKDNVSREVKQAFSKSSTMLTPFNVNHMILPNPDRDPFLKNNKNMAFSSYYWEQSETGNKFLRESGYGTLPGFGPRWSVDEQTPYGTSPAMDSLGDALMLQSVRATYLKQEHKRADPPMAHPQGMDSLDTLPDAKNPVNTAAGTNAQAVYPIQQVNPDTNGILAITQDVREAIREGMYNDLFRMLSLTPNSNMTATEVAERHAEKLLQLGPILEKLHNELFTPLIDRTFDIMWDQDMLLPPPEEVQGMDLKVEFVSMLAQAQKMAATGGMDQFMGFISINSQILPELADVPDADALADNYADALGIENNNTKDQDERDEARAARAQAQQLTAAADTAKTGAEAAKTLSDTPVGEEDNALNVALQGMGR